MVPHAGEYSEALIKPDEPRFYIIIFLQNFACMGKLINPLHLPQYDLIHVSMNMVQCIGRLMSTLAFFSNVFINKGYAYIHTSLKHSRRRSLSAYFYDTNICIALPTSYRTSNKINRTMLIRQRDM